MYVHTRCCPQVDMSVDSLRPTKQLAERSTQQSKVNCTSRQNNHKSGAQAGHAHAMPDRAACHLGGGELQGGLGHHSTKIGQVARY